MKDFIRNKINEIIFLNKDLFEMKLNEFDEELSFNIYNINDIVVIYEDSYGEYYKKFNFNFSYRYDNLSGNCYLTTNFINKDHFISDDIEILDRIFKILDKMFNNIMIYSNQDIKEFKKDTQKVIFGKEGYIEFHNPEMVKLYRDYENDPTKIYEYLEEIGSGCGSSIYENIRYGIENEREYIEDIIKNVIRLRKIKRGE